MPVESWLKGPSLYAHYHVVRRAERPEVYSRTGGRFPALAPPQIGKATDTGFAIFRQGKDESGFEQIANEGRFVVKAFVRFETPDSGLQTKTVYWSSTKIESFADITKQLYESGRDLQKGKQYEKAGGIRGAKIVGLEIVGAWQE